MDTLIALGIGTTIGALIFIIRARKAAKQPVYEPAGIIHHGFFEIAIGGTLYSGLNNSDGTTDVYVNYELLGNYPFHDSLYAIIDHAKENK